MPYIPSLYEERRFGYLYTIASSRFSIPAIIRYLGDTIGIQVSFRYLSIGTLLGFVCVNLLSSPVSISNTSLILLTGDTGLSGRINRLISLHPQAYQSLCSRTEYMVV